ncbi:hypothetical protein BDZ94DRAFT_1312955 [Collybia nuda]|uniref:Uncharacterized protein n=1 Tax=Collybia nuda TaxID=64659 RepID=A0A9P5XXW7_9AGAR|nr:hypothetical protein BDZ94DRAFT_1312955 [Collybia nuda]
MPRRGPTKKDTKSSSSDGSLLGISETILTIINDAARLSFVPFFQEAAGLTLGILNIIRGAKDNKDGFKYLASDACALVYTIIRISQEKNGLTPKDLDNVKELLKLTLASIERFARRETSQSLILRVVRHKSDVGKIQRYRETLRNSLDLFQLEASITIQESLNHITQRQDDFLAALQESLRLKQEDGNFIRVGHLGVVEGGAGDGVEQEGAEARRLKRELKIEHDKLEPQREESERLEKQKADEAKIQAEATVREAQEKPQAEAERERVEQERAEGQPLEVEQPHGGSEHMKLDESMHDIYTEGLVLPTAVERESQDCVIRSVNSPPRTHSQKKPYLYPSKPGFTITQVSGGSLTSIGGNYVKTDSSQHITNTNSGNTTDTTVLNSNNDSSQVYSQRTSSCFHKIIFLTT